MQCIHVSCVRHDDCGILEIIGIAKMPSKPEKCGYFKTEKQEEKQQNRLDAPVKRKRRRKT
jgi:hypothetical protein